MARGPRYRPCFAPDDLEFIRQVFALGRELSPCAQPDHDPACPGLTKFLELVDGDRACSACRAWVGGMAQEDAKLEEEATTPVAVRRPGRPRPGGGRRVYRLSSAGSRR